MSLTLDVPDTIPMSKVRAFLADLGIDAKYLREFYCGMGGVYVEVVALDKDGKPYANGTDIAMHRIAIPLDQDA